MAPINAGGTIPHPSRNIGVVNILAKPPVASEQDDDEEEDDERVDFKLIQSFADKIQRYPVAPGESSSSRARITIPKRGEKDFEPLKETVNLQEMMLQRSREALFNALVGVRGGSSKAMSHAILTPTSPFPSLLVSRGHILDSMGISVRHISRLDTKGKTRSFTELLPEEALYLADRGSLQIWFGSDPQTVEEYAAGMGEWRDEGCGVHGAVEMSVMEAFGVFIGREGLTWERYQAYAYLKRLGYTVQRDRRFIPDHFLHNGGPRFGEKQDQVTEFRTWWTKIPGWITLSYRGLTDIGRFTVSWIQGIGVALRRHAQWSRSRPLSDSLLRSWSGPSYGTIYSKLRLGQAPTQTITSNSPPAREAIYDVLSINPYLPFFAVWKPAVPWSKAKWDKGSQVGLSRQRPDYMVSAVEARTTPMPTIAQLSEVFELLPDEPQGPTRKLGPQYDRKPPAVSSGPTPSGSTSWLFSLLPESLQRRQTESIPRPQSNSMGALRNGDRALIVAVNDSGNAGWVRFGRTGFAEHAVI